ncbi:MAG: hypothetical protein AB1445_10680 [Bacillota bacterium]
MSTRWKIHRPAADLAGHACETRAEDIREWRSLDREDYTVMIFLKSVGEFDGQTFDHLFANTRLAAPRICLLSSNRASYAHQDAGRISVLASVLENVHGHVCKSTKENREVAEKAGIREW